MPIWDLESMYGTLPPSKGGTGVNNGSSTITIGGSVTFSGAFTFAGTLTANTAVTFPTSGYLAASTMALTNNKALYSFFGSIAESATTGVELGYLSGVTSSVQTQLNGKEPSIASGATSDYWRGDKTWQDFGTSVRATLLTGLSISGSAIVSSDSVITAFGKLQNQVNALAGGVNYQGTWNANTNTPALASGIGTKGYYYVVSVAGSTNLDGITDWKLGDWAIFNGTTWDKVDNTDAVISVNGYTGIVTLVTADVVTPLSITNSMIANSTIDLTTKVTGVLPIANGGTNSSTALSNNRIMISSAGSIVEHSAQTSGNISFYDVNGLPSGSTNLTWDNTNTKFAISSTDTLPFATTSNFAGLTSINFTQSVNGTTTQNRFVVTNSASETMSMGMTSNNFTTASSVIASMGYITSTGAGGMGLRTVSGSFKFIISGTPAAYIDGNGIGINTTTVASQPITSDYSVNGGVTAIFKNSSTGAAAISGIRASNNSNNAITMRMFGASFTTAGLLIANMGEITVAGAGGMLLTAATASTNIIFAIGGTAAANEFFRVSSTGAYTSNSATLGLNVAAVANQPITGSYSLNGTLSSEIKNTSNGASAVNVLRIRNDLLEDTQITKYGSGIATSGLISQGLSRITCTGGVSNLLIDSTNASTSIIFAIGGTASANEIARFTSSTFSIFDAINVVLGTTTGTKFGTATTQKMGWWNATPVVQQTGYTNTNVVTSRSFNANTINLRSLADIVGTLINDLKTYGLLGA